jgi:hypothetical protein
MFEWWDVSPGSDGVLQITCRTYTGTVPGGSSSGTVAYALTALRVQEFVRAAPAILAQPQSALVYEGETVIFSVEAGGYPLYYQWVRDGEPIQGAATRTYTLTNVLEADSGSRFSVVVTNEFGVVTSQDALLTVLVPPGIVVPFDQVWRYEASGRNLGTAWEEIDYDDSVWPSGPGPLGFEDAVLPEPIRTTFPNSGGVTYYFRATFNFPFHPADAELVFTNLIDDGAVFYLNGEEILRVGMPEGPIDFSTPAGRTVGDARFETTTVRTKPLLEGTNLLAVEVHQLNTISSDLVWGTAIFRVSIRPTELTIITQPTNLVVAEKEPAAFRVDVAGDGARYQWYRNDEPIAGATRFTYMIPRATGADQGTYYVRVTNVLSQIESDRVTLTVILDTNAPTMLNADGSMSSTQVVLQFSEPLDASEATNSGNYVLTNVWGGTVAVLEAQMLDATTVLLTTGPRLENQNHIVLVDNLRDISLAGNVILSNSFVPVATVLDLVPFNAFWSFYDPVPNLDDPDPGVGWSELGFDTSTWGFGQAGFVYDLGSKPWPVESGVRLNGGVLTAYFRHPFVFPGSPVGAQILLRHVIDDGAILYLDGQEILRTNLPAGLVDYLTPATTAIDPLTISGPITIHTETLRTGTNLLAAELHDVSASDRDRFFACELKALVQSLASGPILILAGPTNQTVAENMPATFTFSGVGASHFQWFQDGVPILGATQFVYTIPITPLSMDGTELAVLASNATSLAMSQPTLLTVLPDQIAPRLLAAYATPGSDTVLVTFSEPVDEASATNINNYVLITDTGAVLPIVAASVSNLSFVVLRLDRVLQGFNGVLTVGPVRDRSVAGNAVKAGSRVQVGFQGPLVSRTAVWRFDQSRQNWGTAWREMDFDDGTWLTGTNVFAYPGNEWMPAGWTIGTVLGYGIEGDFITNYLFRTWLNLPGGILGTVTVTNLIDDGAVFYLNGREVARFRIAGEPTVTTLARGRTDDVGTGPLDMFEVNGTNFVDGDNVIAVTVHQSSWTSSDIVYGSEWFLDMPSVVLPDLEACPGLRIALDAGQVVISWEGGSGCLLEQADTLQGPGGQTTQWTTVTGQTNPYRITMGEAPRFYRLRGF